MCNDFKFWEESNSKSEKVELFKTKLILLAKRLVDFIAARLVIKYNAEISHRSFTNFILKKTIC